MFGAQKWGIFLHTDCRKNFSCHCYFGYLLLRSLSGIENSSQQMSLQCLSTINMVFSDKDKILIRSLYLKGTQKRGSQTNFLRNAEQSVVLKTLRDTGTVYKRQKFEFLIFHGSVATRLR